MVFRLEFDSSRHLSLVVTGSLGPACYFGWLRHCFFSYSPFCLIFRRDRLAADKGLVTAALATITLMAGELVEMKME